MAATKKIRRSCYRRGDKWQARYWPPKGEHVSQTFDTKAEAEEWLETAITAIRTGTWIDPNRGRMPLDEYAETHFFPNNAVHSAENNRFNYNNHVRPRWGDVALEDITKADVVDWVTELKTRDKKRGEGVLSASTIRQIYFVFSKMVRDANDKDFLTRLPLPKSPSLPFASPKDVIPLEPFEVERLASDIKDVVRDTSFRLGDATAIPDFALASYALVYLLAYGGFRLGEGTALRINDLNFASNTISVDEQLNTRRGLVKYVKGSRATGRRYRSVPVSGRVMALVQEHIDVNLPADHRGSTLVFTTQTGSPLRGDNWRTRFFLPAVAVSGLGNFTPHDLRHTAASAWYDEGYDLDMIAKFLGDTVEVVRETYWHIFQHRRDPRQDRMDARFDRGQAEIDADVIDMAKRRRG